MVQIAMLAITALLVIPGLCMRRNSEVNRKSWAYCGWIGCGTRYNRSMPCQCNDQCRDYNNCCLDYGEICEGAPAPNPAPTPNAPAPNPTGCGVKGASTSANNEVNMSIVNGQPATECEWSWQVGLRSRTSGTPWCGGMLIHPEWVLTAAHCLVGESRLNVVAGEYDTRRNSGNEQSRWSSEIIVHPQYNDNTMNNDFGLVRLESPVDITDCVGTVCLPSSGGDVAPGTACWISGWGTLSSGGSQPTKLQEAQVTVLSNSDCKKTSYDYSDISQTMLCAQGKTANGEITDACQGDSGGPLVCEDSDGTWSVYGATSWGMGCADKGYPGIWARVHEVLGWIQDTMA